MTTELNQRAVRRIESRIGIIERHLAFLVLQPCAVRRTIRAALAFFRERPWKLLLLLAANVSLADSPPAGFADLTIEQLMNESVTSVSKKETKLNESAAAISVVTQDDIRRLGITTIPDALRLVPGMDVAQINSHEWAVSSRGFNNALANKLLVMVDGRSVYGTGFGGVVWGIQDVVMEDVDRIEVIRGPGGTLWGANAVNGVINIITKSAKETQGTLISTTVGTEDQPSTSVRYGGQLATNLYYRAYVKGFNRDGTVLGNGQDAPDNAKELQGGLRMDWEPTEDNKLTLQGDYYADRFVENQDMPRLTAAPPYSINFNEVNHDSGGNVLGRWTHEFSPSSSLTLQTYYDHFKNEQTLASEVADTIDFDAQHRFAIGSRNDVMWGLGYRQTEDKFLPSFFVSWTPSHFLEKVFSSFVQDEITIFPDRFKLTVGSKFEHNDDTGFEVQPSARLLWTPTEKQTLWAAVSRAMRTPARTELNARANYAVIPPAPPYYVPALVSLFGNPKLKSEELVAYELGYRIELTKRCSLDLTGFYNDYDRIIATEYGSATLQMDPTAGPYILAANSDQNVGSVQTYGVEVAARWNVTDNWHLTAGYSWLDMHLQIHPGSQSSYLTGSPQQQFQLRSTLNLPGNLELNAAAYYVDQIAAPLGLGTVNIPSYVRLDVGVIWHPKNYLEIGIWGQNLLDDHHAEFASFKTSLVTEMPRGITGRITLRF